MRSVGVQVEMLLPGPTRGGTRGTSYPGPVGTRAREHESAHIKFFCNQTQKYQCKSVASITIYFHILAYACCFNYILITTQTNYISFDEGS